MEVLKCCSLIHIRQNRTHAQLDTQKHSYGTCVNCIYCISGFNHVEAKTSRKLSIINRLSMESSFRELGYGCKISDLKRVLRPVRRVGCVTSASSESGLVCEVVEAKSPTQCIEELNVPPCGTLQISEEQNIEYNDDPRRSCMSGTTLHYLEERNEETLSKRILSLSRSNKVRSATELYASMEASDVQPDIHAYNSFLSCLLRNGFEGDALRVFETMKKKGTTTGHSYSLILKAVASVRGCDSALKMFLEWESGEETRRVFDVIVYNTMLPMCGKEKNWVLTEKIWRRIKDDGYSGTSITYRLLVSTFVQCGQTELALDAYHEMIQKGLEPDRDTIKAIVATCTKEGKWSLALTVFEQMIKNGFTPDVISYNAMINCLGKAGETTLAFKIFDLMKSSGHIPDEYTWNALLTALYRGKRFADALHLFMEIKTEHKCKLNSHLYNTALMSCQRLGWWDHSVQLLWDMEAKGISVSSVSYNHAIGACESARKPRVALQVYQQMIRKRCEPDTFTYLSLISVCVWGSLWVEVENILERAGPNASLYNALIHGFCLQGKVTLARELYSRMRRMNIQPDGKTRALMLQHLSRNSVRQHSRYRPIPQY